MKNLLLVPVAFVLSTSMAFPQSSPRVVSPEIQPDGHVTLRFRAPNVSKVDLNLEGQSAPTPMRKDEHGIWAVTVGPLQPDLYGYAFIADGVSLIDPVNP